MASDDYSLAVWKACEHCEGTGKLGSVSGVVPHPCGICRGYGKCPTFVPLKEIMLVIDQYKGFDVSTFTNTIAAIQQWLERQEGT